MSGAPRAAPRGPAGPVRGTALAPPLGLILARRVAALPDSRLLDRLARGRLWIALLAVGLVGVVFSQISLLKLNTGISRGVQTAQTLERQNTELKLDLSRLGGGERIQESAAAMGFVVPVTGQPKFLDAARANAARAAANVTPPAPIRQLPLGMIPSPEGGTAAVTSDSGSTMPQPGPTGSASAAGSVGSDAVAVPAGPTATADPAAPSTPPSGARVPAAPATPIPAAPAPAPHDASPPADVAPPASPTAVTAAHPAAGGATATPGG